MTKMNFAATGVKDESSQELQAPRLIPGATVGIDNSPSAVVSMVFATVETESYGKFEFPGIMAHSVQILMSQNVPVTPTDAMKHWLKQTVTLAIQVVIFHNYVSLDEIPSDVDAMACIRDLEEELHEGIESNCTFMRMESVGMEIDKKPIAEDCKNHLRLKLSSAVRKRMQEAPPIAAADSDINESPIQAVIEQPQGISDEFVYETFRAPAAED